MSGSKKTLYNSAHLNFVAPLNERELLIEIQWAKVEKCSFNCWVWCEVDCVKL